MSSAFPHILVVGDAMLDTYWNGTAKRISPEAPVPVLHVSERYQRAGGAANVALNLVSMGASATLLCILGKDTAGIQLMDLLISNGIALEVVKSEDFSTIQKIRCVSDHHQMLRIDCEATPSPDLVTELGRRFSTLISDCSLVILSDYAKGSLDQCSALIATAKLHGKQTLVDPKGTDYERYRGATLVKPNWAEFVAIAGAPKNVEDFHQRAESLRQNLALTYLLVTQGEKGMTLFSADGVHHEPAQVREVFDVSGAGDTVAATLASQMAQGKTLRDAMRLANKAAGIAISKFGTSVVTSQELMA